MANNHQGDLKHAINTIRAFSKISKKFGELFCFGFKFQYRNLKTFIHPAHKGSNLKYVKRFEETQLNDDDWKILVKKVKENGMLAICTPFDNDSVIKIVNHGFDILKIASCSITDWPLLEEVSKLIKLPIIASVGGCKHDEISKVNSFFSNRNLELSLLYCVGIYPTDASQLNISEINHLKEKFPDRTFGFSTHENPDEIISVAVALGAGARIFEKHVGLPIEKYPNNSYSVDPTQCERWLSTMKHAYTLLGTLEGRNKNLELENKSLHSLRRGVFAKRKILKDEVLSKENVYFAIPATNDGLTANDFSKFSEFITNRVVDRDDPISWKDIVHLDKRTKIAQIREQIRNLINKTGLVVPSNIRLEISHHYGLENFDQYGMVIITIINKEYCKKFLFMFPGQSHPEQYHKIKHETFLILKGSIKLVLNNETCMYNKGELISIPPNKNHQFSSVSFTVIEELSTKSLSSDSYYIDDKINNTKKRKSFINLW